MDKEEVKEGILFLLEGVSLTGAGSGYTFLEIRDFLKKNNVMDFGKGEEGWNRLKNLLGEMAKENLIEERHFGGVLSERIDYSVENKGSELLKGKRKLLEKKWKIDL